MANYPKRNASELSRQATVEDAFNISRYLEINYGGAKVNLDLTTNDKKMRVSDYLTKTNLNNSITLIKSDGTTATASYKDYIMLVGGYYSESSPIWIEDIRSKWTKVVIPQKYLTIKPTAFAGFNKSKIQGVDITIRVDVGNENKSQSVTTETSIDSDIAVRCNADGDCIMYFNKAIGEKISFVVSNKIVVKCDD